MVKQSQNFKDFGMERPSALPIILRARKPQTSQQDMNPDPFYLLFCFLPSTTHRGDAATSHIDTTTRPDMAEQVNQYFWVPCASRGHARPINIGPRRARGPGAPAPDTL